VRAPGGALGWLWGPGRRRQWRRRVTRKVLAAGCAAAAVAGTLAVARAPVDATTVPVVVAARELAVGEIATKGSVRVVRWPSVLAPDGALSDVREVAGRPLTAPLTRGEPVTAARLSTLSLLRGQPAGIVAVHVAVADPRAVAMIGAGDRVDLLGSSGVVARSVLVLRVERADSSAASASGLSGAAEASAGLVVAASRTAAEAIARLPADQLGQPALTVVLTAG
jgi:Flp pilus assembly protein CpaB